MEEKDPDFADSNAEASWIGKTLNGDVIMVADSGHYPQSQQPKVVADAIVTFLHRVNTGV